MLFITRKTNYAFRILTVMVKEREKIFTTSELAKKLNLAKPFTRAILQKLAKKKIVTSSKGRSGGFKIASSAKNISIVTLIEIFQKPIKFDNCFIKTASCPEIKNCLLKKKLEALSSHTNKELKAITLDKFI